MIVRTRTAAIAAAFSIAIAAIAVPAIAAANRGSATAVGGAPTSAALERDAAKDSSLSAAALAAPTGPASLFVPISPYRTYDSRPEPQPWLFNEFGPIEAFTDEAGVAQIPANATAVTFNATVVSYTGQGFLQVMTPTSAAGPFGTSSTVNWSTPGQISANGGTVGLVNGNLQIYVGGAANGTIDVIIDITGYYVAPT